MHILLDENIPEALASELVGYECDHVIPLGWAGTKNGALLNIAEEAGFRVLLTFDKGISSQQKIQGRKIALLLIQAEGQGVQAVRAMLQQILEAVESIGDGEVRIVTNRKLESR